MPRDAPSQHPPRTRALRILIVDDDRDAVVTLSALLQHDGHEVIEAYNGGGVLNLVRNRDPHAVLLDIGMPGATGFEVARELRLRLGRTCPALIAITAWTQPAALLLDIAMPGGVSGWEVARQIRKASGDASRPLIIAISAKYKQSPEKMAICNHFLAKPYDPNFLLALLLPLTSTSLRAS